MWYWERLLLYSNNMIMREIISVIIPVYNAEKTIKRCADSLIAQTDGNFEVVFVNDGSTDKTEQILEKICEKIDTFKYYTKKNGGAASARNFGIEKACGELICFVDSDDIVSPNYLKQMRKLLAENEADVVCAKYARNRASGFEKLSDKIEVVDGQGAVDELLRMKIDNGPVAKLFAKKAIGETRMPNIAVAEDLYFNYQVFKRSNKVVLNDSVVYSYIKAKDSLTTRKFSLERMGSLEAVKKINAEEKSFYSEARLFMEAYFVCEQIVLAKAEKIFSAEYAEVCGILKHGRKKILSDKRSTKRQRLIAVLLKLGPVFTVKVMTAKSRLA